MSKDFRHSKKDSEYLDGEEMIRKGAKHSLDIDAQKINKAKRSYVQRNKTRREKGTELH